MSKQLRIIGVAFLIVGFAGSVGAKKEDEVAKNLANFDDLDFNRFSKQDWEGFHKSHSNDIKVHWPDGHVTTGLPKHLEDMKAMFVYAPDTRITAHPIKQGQNEWTSVVGVMEGTFSKPMPTPDGKTIPPTGKKFKLMMCTVGHWGKDGLMDEEYLFWDNQTFMNQIMGK
jgi:hypothetical protein